uniref:Serpentine receptor class gamma n=1 Tax=Caenorhabditis tropicalis TaxID=1561998 RepID=A0A1I7SZH0_9PELO
MYVHVYNSRCVHQAEAGTPPSLVTDTFQVGKRPFSFLLFHSSHSGAESNMHPRKDLAVYTVLCFFGLFFIHIPLLCKTFYVPINSYIECAKFCLYMNFQYVGFQICLASINFIFSVALVMTIKQIRFGNIKANLRLILSLKGLLLFITCICSFSVELAAPPMLHIFWIYNSALVHIHLSLEVLVSLFSIWYAHRLEKVNILKIRVSMIDTLRTFSPSNMIYLAPPVGREIVVCPEKQAVLEEGLSQEEIVLNELGNFFNRALAAHHERYPLISFRPPIRFEDYE